MNEWNQPHNQGYPPGYPPPGNPQDPRAHDRKKRKWMSGILSFLVPGTGHFYLGLMMKGVAIMLLIAFNICAIVFAATQGMNVLVIVLLSLLLPIIYFYSLFDALQSTDTVNDRRQPSGWQAPAYGGYPPQAPAPGMGIPSQGQPPAPGVGEPAPGRPAYGPEGAPRSVSASGVIFLAAAAVVLFVVADIRWSHWLFKSSGSMIGAVVLIGAGIGLWFWEMRGQQGRKG